MTPELLRSNDASIVFFQVTEGAMTFRNKIYVTIFAILEFIAVLFFLGFVATRAAEASNRQSLRDLSPLASR